MQNLERRISALESANPLVDEMTLVIRFVAPGHLNAEIDGLRTNEGQRWERLPGESEQALVDRATREVERSQWGNAMLLSTVDQSL